MLSNLETVKQKLLQIVLVGQPELKGLLESRPLLQLRQRLSFFLELKGLSSNEMRSYIHHRLKRASLETVEVTFDHTVLDELYKTTRGIPRLVNSVCDRILMAAFFSEEKNIDGKVASRAIDEMRFILSGGQE